MIQRSRIRSRGNRFIDSIQGLEFQRMFHKRLRLLACRIKLLLHIKEVARMKMVYFSEVVLQTVGDSADFLRSVLFQMSLDSTSTAMITDTAVEYRVAKTPAFSTRAPALLQS
jgi:hypothetical protein